MNLREKVALVFYKQNKSMAFLPEANKINIFERAEGDAC
jgi:hypothetical protein